MSFDRPTDNAVRPVVIDRREVHIASADAELGQVHYPQSGGTVGIVASLHEIRFRIRGVARVGARSRRTGR